MTMGEDQDGELYLAGIQKGEIFRIVEETTTNTTESLVKTAELRGHQTGDDESGSAIRFHAGLEHIDDLLEDLEHALATAQR